MTPFRSLLATAALALVQSVSFAQSWPTKAVRLIVPYPPGGSADILARPIAQQLSEKWGRPVVVDNRPGAGGSIAANTVAKAAPDGHTVVLVLTAHAINASLYAKLPYDTLSDFAPVTLMANVPLILVTPPAVPVGSMKDLVVLAKAKPGQLHFASSGSGNTGHLAAELFKKTTGTDMVHVPYKGSGPAQVALLSGEVELMFDALPSQLAHVKAGKMKPIAVTGARRSPLLPEVPTAIESGFGDFVVEGWYGMLTTAGTPKAIVDKMSADINAVLRQPEMQRRLAEHGFELLGTTPELFGKHVQSEVTRWAAVVKHAGARVD